MHRLRAAIAAALFATLAFGAAAKPPVTVKEPKDIVDWVYKETIKPSKGANHFDIFGKDNLPALFSKTFISEYTAGQKKADKAGEPFIDADPVTNSQDPDVKSHTSVVNRLDDKSALVTASFVLHGKKTSVAYRFIKEGADWRIDDIGDNESSLRKMFKSYLKAK